MSSELLGAELEQCFPLMEMDPWEAVRTFFFTYGFILFLMFDIRGTFLLLLLLLPIPFENMDSDIPCVNLTQAPQKDVIPKCNYTFSHNHGSVENCPK